MTQYPSPYSPPPTGPGMSYGYGVPQDLLAPARRAGLLMIVLGALVIVMGLCMGLFSVMLPDLKEQMPPEQRQLIDQMQQQLPPTWTLAGVFLTGAVLMLVVGILYIILGMFTRRGGLGIVITSLVLTAVVTLLLLVSTLGSLFHPGQASGACVPIVGLGLFILLMVWLIQAARNAPRISATQNNYQAQYQQYLQMQQMYGQAGYGYGTQPPIGQPPIAPPPQTNPPPPPQYPSNPSSG